MTDWIGRIPWSLVFSVIAFLANYGFIRGTVAAFRREIEELRKAAAPIVDLDKRLAVTEVQLVETNRRCAELAARLEEMHREHHELRRDVDRLDARGRL